MCEYCNLEKYHEHIYDEDTLVKVLEENDYTHMEIQYKKVSKIFKLVAIGDDVTELRISFCPMCGRKLGGN